jgi:hypothetical protein
MNTCNGHEYEAGVSYRSELNEGMFYFFIAIGYN